MHYGLLPRANRGIFAINELPDLAGKIQVGLFNIMQEGDVQIKGYPVRLPLDVLLVFTANPEDYTARGKIVTPLKDRIGSEIRTHYPATVEEGMAITAQEAWTERGTTRKVVVPDYLREVVEQIAFLAREDKRVDRRSGVSQRLPIACLEAVVSSAEQRAARNREGRTAARIADVYAAAPAITGKLELEYEGELKGADNVARELIRSAVGRVFSRHLSQVNLQPVIQWFEMGGELKMPETASAAEELAALKKHPGTDGARGRAGRKPERCAAGGRRRRVSSWKDCGRKSGSAATSSAATTPSVPSRPSSGSRRDARRGVRTTEEFLQAVKYIRYSRYTGEPADEVDLQELMKRLGDFLLQSGYRVSNSWESPKWTPSRPWRRCGRPFCARCRKAT